jgi:hypothetical protein
LKVGNTYSRNCSVKDHLVFWAKLVKQMASNKEL